MFDKSGIFVSDIDRYYGQDYVEGQVGGVDVKWSELSAIDIRRQGKKNERVVIFQGLFVVADFPKKFKSQTVVLPDLAESLLGSWGRMLQGWNFQRADLVEMESPEFEERFVVYARDQIEARYVLSLSMMQRIVDFQKRLDESKEQLYLAFEDSKMYLAISSGRDRWDMSLWRQEISKDNVRQFYEDFMDMIGIVEDFRLDRKIWKT